MAPEPVTFRTIEVGTTRISDAEMEVTGRLRDEVTADGSACASAGPSSRRRIHDLRLTLSLRYPELEILEACAELVTFPFPDCQSLPPAYRKLVGLRIGEGFVRKAQARVGRERGCVHLSTLLFAMLAPIQQAVLTLLPEHPEPSFFTRIVDSCHSWRRHGPLYARLREGSLPKPGSHAPIGG
ncbi:MAG: DUF2889 domain-containing protein [Deltaproteobacteria bacterium]|nr:DUF2889 domain-containing protein [Deltaproteobacteria bacterium]